MRLVKYLAERGYGSRRWLDAYIQKSGVFVNGTRIFDPATAIIASDRVEMAGKIVPTDKPARRIFLFYKPRGVLTTHDDPQGRPCVGDFFKGLDPTLKTVGRLDQESEGLLIFTNDGAFKRYLELPKNGVQRTYCVHYAGVLDPENVARAACGLTIAKVRYRPCHITKVRAQSAKKGTCEVQIFEGKNREVRRIMGFFGCAVMRLVRLSYGPFSLGRLAPGSMREVL